MNLKKLILHNFQSHQNTTINFHPGMNVIVGSSDEGKSAVIRALAAVLQNDVNNAYVRHGEDCFEVTAEFDDGSSVARIKGAKVNKYIVNGEEFERLGDSVPKQVIEVLGGASVFIDDNEIPVTISKQGVEPFLLSESAPVRAKMLGMISGLDVIDRALREMQKDSNQTDKDIKISEGILTQQEKELKDVRDELLIKEPMYLALDEAVKSYYVDSQKLDKLTVLRHDFGFLNVDIEAAKSEMLVLDVVVNSISFDRLLRAHEKQKRLFLLHHDWNVLNVEIKSAQGAMVILDQAMKTVSFDVVLRAQKRWDRLVPLREHYRQNEISISQLTTVSDQLLGMDFDDIGGRFTLCAVMSNRLNVLSKYGRELDDVDYAIKKLGADVAKNKSILDLLRGELSELDVCPFCLRSIPNQEMEKILGRM